MQFRHYIRDGADVASMLRCFAGFASFFWFGFRNIVIYIYLYLFTFILERFLFFRTKVIVQAYDEVGHTFQVSAVCSGLTHLVRGSLRGFSPAGHWPQSEERLCTSSGQSDRSVRLVSPVCARLTL